MIISISNSNPSKAKLDTLLVVVSTERQSGLPWDGLPLPLPKICAEAAQSMGFSVKPGATAIFPTLGRLAARRIALAVLGQDEDVAARLRTLGKAFRLLHKWKAREIGLVFNGKPLPPELIAVCAEEASYDFTDFAPAPKSKPTPFSRLVLFGKPLPASLLRNAIHLASSVRYARGLANRPPNLFSPELLAGEARRLARRHGLRCRIWNERQLRREGFGGILAVGSGSAHPPRFIRLDYRGGPSRQPPRVVIGKAITFDTGGISIKPSDKMDEMKFDKCGGIAALGIMDAVATLRLPLNLTVLIPSAENMPSATAYRPGDLIKTLSGKYVEVLNTDAEGRIVLADALTYAQRLDPSSIVDLATLTGACLVCFGHEAAAVLGNQDALVEQLRAAAERTGQKIWPLPPWPEYQEKVKSDIAFVKNTAGREGGTITGACFLNAFVDAKIPWAHLDIAGMAWTSKEEPHRAKGATAFGVRLVTDWLRSTIKARG